MGLIHDQMLQDLQLRNYSNRTIGAYMRLAERYVEHYMVRPDLLERADVEAYLLFERNIRGMSASSLKTILAAIKFMYRTTLEQPEKVAGIVYPMVAVRLPQILSGSEVERVLAAIHSPKYRAAAMMAYGTGMRVLEICRLRIDDVECDRMLIRVCEGKGGRDRYVMLPERLLTALRKYWYEQPPSGPFVFASSRDDQRPMPPTTLRCASRPTEGLPRLHRVALEL